MKKLFTFCFFAFALLIGTQSALAQDKVNLKEKAYLKAKEMRSTIKFDDNTLEQVYEVYYKYEKSVLSIKETEGSENTEMMQNLNNSLEANLKEAVGEDLYKRYLMVNEKNKRA